MHLLPAFVDIVCLHLTNIAENIMFLHNITFQALVAFGEFSYQTPHLSIHVYTYTYIYIYI